MVDPKHVIWKALNARAWRHTNNPEECKLTATILAALSEAGFELVQWQPIETAPKDGTAIWVTGSSEEFEYPLIAHWANDPCWANDPWDGQWWEPSENLISEVIGECHPTHWMPLPAPPTRSGAGTDQETAG